MTPEFARTVALESIGHVAHGMTITADDGERAALAVRFGLVTIDALSATASLTRGAGGVEARGALHAAVVQACVITGDPVPATVDEAFAIRFVEAAMLVPAGDEIELAADDLDLVAHDGRAIDLGEAVAQTLGLALDPFPRAVADDVPERVWRTGPDARPFAALQGLIDGQAKP